MARELRLVYDLSKTVLASGLNAANGANAFTVALSESHGYYTGSLPTLAQGIYDVQYVDGSSIVGVESIVWDGSARQDVDTATILGAITTLSNGIGSGGITFTITSPLSTDGTITIVRGDDYRMADGRSIVFTFTGQPSLSGATVVLSAISNRTGTKGLASVVGTVSGSATVTFELTSTQTSNLETGTDAYTFDVQATLADAHIITLVTGSLTVTPDVS